MRKRLFVILLVLFASLGFAQNTQLSSTAIKEEDIDLVYLDGTPCRLKDFEGCFVLVDIWGQGCKPCVDAIPDLNELQRQHKKQLIILAINDRIYLNKLPQFLKEKEVEYLVVLPKTDTDLMSNYFAFSDGKFSGFPFYALIDKTGKVLKRDIRYKDVEAYLNP